MVPNRLIESPYGFFCIAVGLYGVLCISKVHISRKAHYWPNESLANLPEWRFQIKRVVQNVRPAIVLATIAARAVRYDL